MSQAPFGTHFEDGLRVGPYPRENQNVNLATSTTQPRQSQNYTMNGPGILMAPLTTYAITPKWSAEYDVTAAILPANIGNLTLTGDAGPAVRFTIPGSNPGKIALQMDYPRTVRVRGTSVTATDVALNIKVYGWDFYGNPMTEIIPLAAGAVVATRVYGLKAFYVVTGVRVELANPAGAAWTAGAFAVYTANTFGLPYRLFSTGDLMQIGVSYPDYANNQYAGYFDLAVSGGAAPDRVTLVTNISTTILPNTSGGFVASTANPFPTGTSRDVRGIYTPPPAPGQAQIMPNATYMLTYYVRGADQGWMQEFYRRQDNPALPPVYPANPPLIPVVASNPYQALIPYDISGTTDAQKAAIQPPLPLNTNDIYGYKQYYEAQPE